MKIKRERYVIVKNNRTEIWCGLARNFHFRKVDEIGNMPVKTYATVKKAKLNCSQFSKECEILPVIEEIYG